MGRPCRDRPNVYGIGLVIVRVFGIIGPDQRPHYLVPGLISRIRNGELAGVPGLDNVRDYLDPRDVSRHLASLASDTSTSGYGETVVNVCSGEETRVGDLLDELLRLSYGSNAEGLEEACRQVSAAPGRLSDVEWAVGDPSVCRRWSPVPSDRYRSPTR